MERIEVEDDEGIIFVLDSIPQQLASLESMKYPQQDDDFGYTNQPGKSTLKFRLDDDQQPASKTQSEFLGRSLYLSPIMMSPSEKKIPSYLIKSTSKIQTPSIFKMKKDELDIV